MSTYKTLTVIPTVQATPDYAAGDVLFSPTEIPAFFPSKNSSAQIVSLLVIDKVAANTSAFTLYFTPIATSFGTVNATADAAIGVIEETQATIPIVAGDWISANTDNANTCMLTDPATDGIGSIVSGYNWARNSFSKSLYIVGIADDVINCASTSDLIIKIGVKYN
jgi:hypothetical protein